MERSALLVQAASATSSDKVLLRMLIEIVLAKLSGKSTARK